MKKEDLFAAIGEVSESRLGKYEKSPKRGTRRLLLRCGLAAAVVVVLAVTVFAIPAVRNALFGGNAELEQIGGVYGSEYGVEDRTYDDVYNIWLDIAVSPDAPQTIQEHYLPMELAENWALMDCSNAYDTNTFFAWTDSEQGVYATFEQHCAKNYTSSYPFDCINVTPSAIVSESTVEHEDLTLCRFEVAPNHLAPVDEVFYYWSDGNYIFKFSCSAALTQEEIFAILDSLAPVGDITQYCLPKDSNDAYTPVYPDISRYDMPSYLPEGFEQCMGEVENGHSMFFWEKGGSTAIVYGQYTWNTNADVYINWERSVEKCPREVLEIEGNTVTIFEFEDAYSAFWEADGYYYMLSTPKLAGYDARAELEKMVKSIRPVENITPYLLSQSTE